MSKKKKALATKIFTIRFTLWEFANLMQRATNAGMTLAVYIRHILFGEQAEERKRVIRAVIKDVEAFSKLLSILSATRIANNINQIAKATNQGMVYMSPEMEKLLRHACHAIIEMRDLLLQALGKQ